jgi:hypothetical protein
MVLFKGCLTRIRHLMATMTWCRGATQPHGLASFAACRLICWCDAKPEQMIHVDERKLTAAQVKARDTTTSCDRGLGESAQSSKPAQVQQDQQDQQNAAEANSGKILSDAFKNIAQGRKHRQCGRSWWRQRWAF